MNCARAHARNMTLPRRPIPCRSARLSFRRRCISETAVSVVERATDDSPSFSFGAETIRRFSQLAMTQTRSSDSGRSLQLKPDVAAYRVYLSVCRRFFCLGGGGGGGERYQTEIGRGRITIDFMPRIYRNERTRLGHSAAVSRHTAAL